MPEIKFSELLARLAGHEPTVKSVSGEADGPRLYAQPHYDPNDDRLERVLYFLVSAQVESEYPIYLTTLKGRLEALPFSPEENAMPWGEPTGLNAPHWLAKLCQLCEAAVLPHIESLRSIPFYDDREGKPNFTQVRCGQIVDNQIDCFRYRRRAFFHNNETWFQWECWSHAGSWLKAEVDAETACKTIGVDPAMHASLMGKTLVSCRSEVLASTLESEDLVDVASPVTPAVAQENAVVTSVMQRYVDPSVMIGNPDLSFPKDAGCAWGSSLPAFNRARKMVPPGLWWWRKLNSRDECSDDLHDLFFQNWARSAFLYEYRCRRNRTSEQAWFGAPWVTLNHIQRAILRELWPPEVAGPRTFVRPIVPVLSDFGKLSRETLQVSVDLEKMSDAAITDQVRAMLTELRKARGFPTVAQGGGAVRTGYRWRVLEAMDEAFYHDSTLLDNDRKAKSTVEKEYRKACEEAGVE